MKQLQNTAFNGIVLRSAEGDTKENEEERANEGLEEAVSNLIGGPQEAVSPKALRFARELRQKRKSCPLCTVVQQELEKGNEMPVEERIYLEHLRAAHSVVP